MSRQSRYQVIVYEALRNAVGPLSATELHVRLGDTGIGIATVYRILNKGLDEGELVAIELPSGPKRFEMADKPVHHHFECMECHTVFDVMGHLEGMDRLVPEGFELKQHEVVLSGRCRDCIDSAGDKS